MHRPYHIPAYWSAEQAQAIFDLLDALRDRIWEQYGQQIQEQDRIDRQGDAPPDAWDIDDPVPF
jgi:hypothetical protein